MHSQTLHKRPINNISGGRIRYVHLSYIRVHDKLSKINVKEYRRGNQKSQSRETGNIGYTRWRKTKHKHNTISVGHHYT